MAPFNGMWLWPVLGIIFLPFTTLFYVFMWTPGVGLVGWDWLWIGLAVFMDIASLTGHGAHLPEPHPGLQQDHHAGRLLHRLSQLLRPVTCWAMADVSQGCCLSKTDCYGVPQSIN